MSWIGSFARALAGGLYWWAVGWLLYVVTGGDRLPSGQERSVWQDYGPVTLIVVGAIVLGTFLTHVDRGRTR